MFLGCIKNKKGLSLVEVLVATALIVLVLGGFINAFYYAVNLRANSQKRLNAVLLAQSYIEEIRSARGKTGGHWENRSELEEWLVYNKSFNDNGGGELNKDNVTVRIEEVSEGSPQVSIPSELFEMTVEVNYSDEMDKGKARTVFLMTRLREL